MQQGYLLTMIDGYSRMLETIVFGIREIIRHVLGTPVGNELMPNNVASAADRYRKSLADRKSAKDEHMVHHQGLEPWTP